MPRLGSVVSRIIALHVVAIVATSMLMPLAMFYLLRQAIERLHDQALQQQAAQIMHYLSVSADGSLRLELPPALVEYYSREYGRAAYAVLDRSGRVLFSSLPGNRAIAGAPRDRSSAVFFRQDHVGTIASANVGGVPVGFFEDRAGSSLYGASIPVEFRGRRLSVQVVEDILHRDVLIDDVVDQFLTHVGWIAAPILLLLLIIDVVIIHRAMFPIVTASALASEIGPGRTDLRLPEADMPREVLSLVRAVNRALDRLDAGFRAQREFTAEAAHELRTPLAILRTQIDLIADPEVAGPLRHDVDSMGRLVNQMLEMSELESFVIAEDETADLVVIAAEVAAFLAPLAVSQTKTVAVTGALGPVIVRGNADAIARALRNLVENALAHTPAGSAVELAVARDGTISVLDRGPGVPKALRDNIFKRFWRGDRRRSGSGGLGLAIVARIAEMHDARLSVGDRPGGGAVFAMRFAANASASGAAVLHPAHH